MPRIKPGAAGLNSKMLPMCFNVPLFVSVWRQLDARQLKKNFKPASKENLLLKCLSFKLAFYCLGLGSSWALWQLSRPDLAAAAEINKINRILFGNLAISSPGKRAASTSIKGLQVEIGRCLKESWVGKSVTRQILLYGSKPSQLKKLSLLFITYSLTILSVDVLLEWTDHWSTRFHFYIPSFSYT